ncbi:Cadherin-5 [Bagarius yarrelli]|uniref:Cadherin-5 n=1 Tax=Bagarius yarrelli TaxID=175774 RepID=A0A556VVG7_BAGYA|nr:Cadherin-5 [Bagarius yarrelli]
MVFLNLLLSVAVRVEDISASSVLQRHKREWQWNMFIVYEEKPPQFPPEVIGKLKNTNFNESKGRNVEFRLSGEGAGDIFAVNDFGDVLVLKKLDREKISSYKLTAQIFNTQSGRELEEQSEFTIKSEYKVLVQASDTPGPARGLSASTVVTININDINDNQATFSKRRYHIEVKEDEPVGFKITTLDIQDRDEKQNKKPVFTVEHSHEDSFDLEMNDNNDGVLILKKELDYETKTSYTFTVSLEENVVQPPDNMDTWTSAQIHISVKDVDEPPVFSQREYTFSVHENQKNIIVGSVSAKDTDKTSHRIRYTHTTNVFTVHNDTTSTRELKCPLQYLNSWAMVKIKVLDINDNDPELVGGNEVYICQNDESGTVIGVIGAFDKDENPGKFHFSLTKQSSNFSIHDNLMIVILFVLRKRYQKQALVSLGKPSGEIHEQLVAYDEEGGGEMDTNIYDVSILTSANSDGRLGLDLPPTMYAVVKKPSACKGDMAAMIEVKKDEADHDRDGIPYDTLHIYGYEGSESLAGSLSSLESSSSVGSDLDYDFLNDWGPRFRTLAQIYSSGANDSY